jgi:hypothetical protein
MADQKRKTTIKINGVKKNSKVNVTGRDVKKGVASGYDSRESDSDVSIEVRNVENGIVDVQGRDYIEYSPSNFQALVDSVENLLSQRMDNQYTKEMLQIVHDVKHEKGKAKPNVNAIITLLKKLAGLIPLANLTEPAKQLMLNFINVVKGFFHIG